MNQLPQFYSKPSLFLKAYQDRLLIAFVLLFPAAVFVFAH